MCSVIYLMVLDDNNREVDKAELQKHIENVHILINHSIAGLCL